MSKLKQFTKNYYPAVLIAILVAILMKYIFFIGLVPTESMEPTIPKESLLLGLKGNSDIKNYDIVVFRRDNIFYVKRVIGIPGDEITFSKEKAYVNGEEDPHEGTYKDSKYIVPDNKLFVMGDNRDHSYDSRSWDDPYLDIDDVISNRVLIVKLPSFMRQ